MLTSQDVPPPSGLKVKSQVTWSQSDIPLEKHELLFPAMLPPAICMESLTSSSNSDHSTLLSKTCSFVQAHVALTVLPSDQSQASASRLGDEGPARIKDEVQ